MLGSLAAFVAVSAVVICTPGQDTALTIRNALSGGRGAGIATAAGVALGQLAWTLAASAGLVALLSASEPAFRALKLFGAAYLVYLGAQSLWSALSRRNERKQQSVAKSRRLLTPRRALGQGALSNLGNPKMAIFFASLLPQFAGPGEGAFVTLLGLGLLFCALTLAWLSLYAVAVARLSTFLQGRIRRAIDAVTGIVLVAFGVRLAEEER
ncbi:MAG: LysE family translocator [Actinobacteria bacterium]|nr:LysE family translocator [Actinomycetota bacterium]